MENKGNKNSNVIAIVGFILSFFIGIAGLICSIIGLVKSKELKDGKGFSIAGIIISSLRIMITIFIFILGMLIIIDETKEEMNSPREKIIERIEEKNDYSKAYNIIKNKWESEHKTSGNIYSYVYMGIYKNNISKEYYVFDIKWLVENHHYSSIGYYAVSVEDNDYYFIENSPEFLETGIIETELKTIS